MISDVFQFKGLQYLVTYPNGYELGKNIRCLFSCMELARYGGNARMTIYPENGHDAWSDTYGNPEVFDWLLSCEKKEEKHMVDNYKDSNVYG